MVSLINLLSPENLANPYPLYEQLRSEEPILCDDTLGRWLLTGYADILAGQRDSRATLNRQVVTPDLCPER